jgi:hypothetical protein
MFPATMSDYHGAYLAFVAKLEQPPYSRSPRWIPRPFGASGLRQGERVRAWDGAATRSGSGAAGRGLAGPLCRGLAFEPDDTHLCEGGTARRMV